jgi:hypothetical protein
MKLTPKRAKVIIQRYHELREEADRFLNQIKRNELRDEHAAHGYGIPDPQLDYDGGVLYERNTSCHCHPTMQTFKQPAEKFFQWLEKNNQ